MKKFYSIVATVFCLMFTLQTIGQQIITIGTGTAISAISPQNHARAYTVTEILYLQSEINTSGAITSLAFEKHDGTNLDSIQNVQIFLAHTNATSYLASVFDTTGAGYVEVYNGSFPNNALTGWMEVQLQNQFIYNNSQNLQVLFLKTNSTTNSVSGERARYLYSIPGGNRVRRYNSDTPYQIGVTNLTTTTFTPNIKLTFVPPVPPACPVLEIPADSSMEVCLDNPEFSWTMPFGSPASNFEFYLGTDGGGISLPTDVMNGVLTGNVNSHTYIGLLNPSTTYYWSVIGINVSGSSSGCVINSFTTTSSVMTTNITSTPDTNSNCLGTATANISGGTPPYTITWSAGSSTNLCYGWHSATITDSNGCMVKDSVFVGLFTGINENSTTTSIKLFPNPVKDLLFISSDYRINGLTKIYTLTGKLVHEEEVDAREIKLNVEDLNPGIYFIEIESRKYKFIKN